MNFELWFDPTVNSYCLLQESNLNYQFLISNSVKVADFIAKSVDDAIIQRDRFLQWCPECSGFCILLCESGGEGS